MGESEPHIESSPPPGETTSYQGRTYSVAALIEHADHLPTADMPLSQLVDAVGPDHKYWEDSEGKPLGPHELLQDWQAAQANPLWADHVDQVKTTASEYPIWVVRDGQSGDLIILNGAHRLTRAFLEQRQTIPHKFFDSLPESAIVEE